MTYTPPYKPNPTTGTYLGHWVKTATSDKVEFLGKTVDTGTLQFHCKACNQHLFVDQSSFGQGGDLIPFALQTWVNKHCHKTEFIRDKIESYIQAAIKLSQISHTYIPASMEHVFTCSCGKGFELGSLTKKMVQISIHEDEFVEGDQRLRVPDRLTQWMGEHKHEDSAEWIKSFSKVPIKGKPVDVIKFDDIVTWSTPAGAVAHFPKPFMLPKAEKPPLGPVKMPKELSSNSDLDSDTLKTFEGRKFRK